MRAATGHAAVPSVGTPGLRQLREHRAQAESPKAGVPPPLRGSGTLGEPELLSPQPAGVQTLQPAKGCQSGLVPRPPVTLQGHFPAHSSRASAGRRLGVQRNPAAQAMLRRGASSLHRDINCSGVIPFSITVSVNRSVLCGLKRGQPNWRGREA